MQVVKNKNRKRHITSGERKKATGRKLSKKAVHNPCRRDMLSVCLRYVFVLCVAFLFFSGFYYFFVRPYKYRWQSCPGRKEYQVCIPCGYDVHGIDISHYQGMIDWKQLSENRSSRFPISFVFMKATEGGDHTDTMFVRNFEEALRHGFIRGAYHFFSPVTNPHKQADFYINHVRLASGDFPPVLDVESIGKCSPELLRQNVQIWLERVEMHYGVKPILYTSYKFKQKYLNGSPFDGYPYWIAHYYVDSVRYEGEWHFWQHTDIGCVPGIREKVDLNVFNGSMEELLQFTIR